MDTYNVRRPKGAISFSKGQITTYHHSSARDVIMAITAHQQDLLERLQTSYTNGLTTGDASRRREENDSSSGGLNSVRPPINCPKWVCCLL